MKIYKIIAVLLIIVLLLSLVMPIFAADGSIDISSKEEFIEFAKECTLDTWSYGKTFNLTCDIDFDDGEFFPVPTFGGTFNGNGYTLSGINISKDGSYTGVFRYIQPYGVVKNLNVEASIIPGGSKSFVGGIVGENSGTVELCCFDGTVNGESVVGGIAGNNTDEGRIISCTSSGSIIGETSAGGITGKNEGYLQNCVNNAEINTVYKEREKNALDIETDTGAIIESYKNYQEETEEESFFDYTDIGGIAGYTSGIIQGCINYAAVGYPHVGYNIGGIAGIQSGYLLGCKNYGVIQGRKDVGGIVGQAEPYVLLSTSKNTLQDIHQHLSNLHTMVNQLINDTDNLSNNTERYLNQISKYTQNAQTNTEVLINQGTDFIDDNLGEMNAQIAIFSNTLDKLIPVFEDLENSSEDLENSLKNADAALKGIESYMPDLKNEIDEISSSLKDMIRAEKNLNKAFNSARQAIDNLDEAVQFNNPKQTENAIKELSAAIEDIITAKHTVKTSLEKIQTLLKTKPDSFEALKLNVYEIIQNIETVTENLGVTISSLQTISKSLDTIVSNAEVDFSAFRSAAQNIESSIEYLENAIYNITGGLYGLSTAVRDIFDELELYADDSDGKFNMAKDDLYDAITLLIYAMDDIHSAMGNIKNIISDLSKEEPLEFVKLGDDFKEASSNLFDSLSGISGEIEGLGNEISRGRSTIAQSISSISDEFYLIVELMMSEMEDLQNSDTDLSDVFIDVSDEDIENIKQGKVEDCQNFGKISADRNSGGIAGAMAIEYSKDPEDEIEKPNTFHFTYQTKAVLQLCINDGEVVGKKDCTGGIVGLAEIGTIYKCENYADVSSTNGDYVGGVAGKSESVIRKSYSKCSVDGKRYVGGISGKAETVYGCYAIVSAEGVENIGSICGQSEDLKKVSMNYFVNNDVGAIDGISYTGNAEPISFEELRTISGIPKWFISFTITFIADDKIIETQEIEYGYETKRIKYPAIPEKEGYFGNWKAVDCETITENLEIPCEYEKYITTLASVEKNETGKLSVALAEGEFTDKAELHITQSTQTPPVKVQENVKVYDIILSDTEIQRDDTVNVRLLNQNKDRVAVWLLEDGNWHKTKVSERGKYVVLQTKGPNSTICVQYTPRSFGFIIFLAIIVLAGGIFLFVYIRMKKRCKTVQNL